VRRLEDAGVRVFVSSETDLPASLASYESPFALDEMHDALHYADLYVGEGATMAEEAATLGTPAVYVSSLGAGIVDELTDYGLMFHHDGPGRQSRAVATATRILAEDDPAKWEQRRQRLLSDTVDVTSSLCDELEGVAVDGRTAPRQVVSEA
jgi:predicted glycosyltransferase